MTHEFQINRNGDTPDTLKSEFIAVMNAARELTAALQAMTVNGQSAIAQTGQDRAVLAQNVEAIRIWAEAGAIRVMNQS